MRGLGVGLTSIIGMLTAPSGAQGRADLEGERVLAVSARCMVRAAPREAAAWLDMAPDSTGEDERFILLLKQHRDCLELPPSLVDQQLAAQVRLGQIGLTQALTQASNQQTRMAFSRRAFRGAIAERLYIDRLTTGGALAGAASTSDDASVIPVPFAVVRCAAARDPSDADRLVRAKRLSAEEAQAAKALSPALQVCGQDRGRIDLSGTALHGWLAEALYKQRGAEMAERR